jgi:ribosomal protein S18 acetylase RimI-like enzyme
MSMARITIREATIEDASVMALIGAATCLESFSGMITGDSVVTHAFTNHTSAAYTDHLSDPQSRAWLAEIAPGSCPIGYALMTPTHFAAHLTQPDDLELKRLFVFSRLHGTGTGFKLIRSGILAALAHGARRLLLGFHPDNALALAFYKRVGFIQIGTRDFHVGPKIFRDPVLALTLGNTDL